MKKLSPEGQRWLVILTLKLELAAGAQVLVSDLSLRNIPWGQLWL